MKLDFSRFEPLAGSQPNQVVVRHPAGGYLALQVLSEGAGIWEEATGALVWTYEGATALTRTADGTQLLLWALASPNAERGAPGRFERRSWPADVFLSACTFALPWKERWPYDLWVAPGAQLAVVRWFTQGFSGWEPIVLSEAGDTHLAGAGFEMESGGGYTHPVLSPSGHFAVSGYQTLYVTTRDGGRVPRQRGRFEVGRVVVMDLHACAFREILVDDAVPVQLHGTAAGWVELPVFLDETHFSVSLPTGATRVFTTRG